MDRRVFSKSLLVSASTGLLGACQSSSLEKQIDCHAHLWPAFGDYPFREGISEKDLAPASFRAKDLIEEGSPFGIKRFVLIQHLFYHGYDYSYLGKVAAENTGTFAVVGALDKHDKNLANKIKNDAGTVVSGYRIPSKNSSWLDGAGMDEMWNVAADYDQAICLLRNKNVLLESVYEKCRKFPKTRVVIDHYGHVDPNNKTEVEFLWRLSQMKNVYLKVSKYYGNGQAQPPYLDMLPFFKDVLRHFGSEKLMWGSDSPYQLNGQHSYRASYEILAKFADCLSPLDKQNIFQKTAEKVFFKA
jgi:predicted TIM-barrel fold metal-dependent hydrolase